MYSQSEVTDGFLASNTTIYHQERHLYGSLGPSVIGLKKGEIGADFEFYCTTREAMDNQMLLLDPLRRVCLYAFRNGILTPVWRYSALG